MAGGTPQVSSSPIDKLLDAAPIGAFQIRVAALCCLIAMLDGFDTQAVAFVAPVIGREWGIAPDRFGLIFSAGLLGIMVGQLVLGPLADRYGRRPVIIGCTALFGVLSLATAAVDNWMMLLVLRFLTGIGLGGATPNLITLTCEVAPPRSRATMITAMFAGFPLGAAIGAYISSMLIPAYGWQSVFILGGAMPLALLLVVVIWLPESPQFLYGKGKHGPVLDKMLDAMVGPNRAPLAAAPAAAAGIAPKAGYGALFAGGLAGITVPLWIAYFCSLLMIYFLMSWLPTVARESGLPLDTAIISAVFLNVGGAIGGIALGRVADKFGAFRTLAAGYAIAGLSLAAIGFTSSDATLLMAFAFIAGLFTIGGQTAMNAAASGIYPAEVRATGLGAAFAVGRTGSIIGPWVGGLLLASNWELSAIFTAVAMPAALTVVIAILLSRRLAR
ncbi:MFS transporter [Sphingoaurantiacus capsulatus]|uniref:MFS transporter n=1 Tax=Sphingoaurantiacus capsulatus TaxID=1771310 RepID=A0ABV7XA18_9SPHN